MFSPDRYTAALRFAAQRHLAQNVPGSELPYAVHVTSVVPYRPARSRRIVRRRAADDRS